MANYGDEYSRKSVSAEKAVQAVKSGDTVAYSHFVMFPRVLDAALAKRAGEVIDVKLKCAVGMAISQASLADPERKSFTYLSSFFSASERKLGDKGLAFYLPGNYGQDHWNLINGHGHAANVAMIKTTPMDKNGFFNFGTSCSYTDATVQKAATIIVEVNSTVPRCLGGSHEQVHISDVDYIVETDNQPMIALPQGAISPAEEAMAKYIVEEIEDGSCLQLGIGAIPNAVGKIIADSDLKDLGCHSEMISDAYVDLYEKGKMSGTKKQIDKYKMVYTFAMGSQRLYDMLDNNPACATYPVGYTNHPPVIALNDKVISVNNTLQVDLFGQACSESHGNRQISGTGGQLDFTIGATFSKGGKAFICLKSTQERNGELISRIVPQLNGIVSIPRTYVMYVVTEYGKAKIKGNSTYEIAENLIAIAHPKFRDELVQQADKMSIWTKTNKKDKIN